MAKGSAIYTEEAHSEYLTDTEKDELAASGRQFHITEIDEDEGQYGLMWTCTLLFNDTGEVRKLSLSQTPNRDPKFQAWKEYLATHDTEMIEEMVYKRGKTRKGQTWSDITDA